MGELDKKRIGLEIKIRRLQNNMTQIDLSEFLGVSQTHLSNVESGRVMFSLKLLMKIKRRFGCTLDELVDPGEYPEFLKKHSHPKKYKLIRCN